MSSVYDDGDDFNADPSDGDVVDDGMFDAEPDSEQAPTKPAVSAAPAPASSNIAGAAKPATSNGGSSSAAALSVSSIRTDSKRSSGDEVVALSFDELRERRDRFVADVASVLYLPSAATSMLLRQHKWNKEKVCAAMLDDRTKVLTTAGCQYLVNSCAADAATNSAASATTPVPIDAKTHAANVASSAGPTPSTVTCRICVEVFPRAVGQSYGVGCGHYFCHPCWRQYLEDKIRTNGVAAVVTRCPAFKCGAVVPDAGVQQLLPSESWVKYDQLTVRAFVEENRNMRWCPAARCDTALMSKDLSVLSVFCKCGYKFCFKCKEEAHDPVTCTMLSEWLDKCKNESETAHWIMANTQKCPKCQVRIEKNQGCNHMKCRACTYEFCWVCSGKWSEHGNSSGGFYKCNKYDPKAAAAAAKAGGAGGAAAAAAAAVSSAEAIKLELNRYLHYYSRYHNHDQAKKFADKQRTAADLRMQQLQAKTATANNSALQQHVSSISSISSSPDTGGGGSWMDVQFVKAAVDQVIECRRVLKYTYVLAYYLPKGSAESELFEFLQQQLETNTEQLSELSEYPVDTILDERTQIVNYTRITKNFLANLIDGVTQGLTVADSTSTTTEAKAKAAAAAAAPKKVAAVAVAVPNSAPAAAAAPNPSPDPPKRIMGFTTAGTRPPSSTSYFASLTASASASDSHSSASTTSAAAATKK